MSGLEIVFSPQPYIGEEMYIVVSPNNVTLAETEAMLPRMGNAADVELKSALQLCTRILRVDVT